MIYITDINSARNKARFDRRRVWYSSGEALETARSMDSMSSCKSISLDKIRRRTWAEDIAWKKPWTANRSNRMAEGRRFMNGMELVAHKGHGCSQECTFQWRNHIRYRHSARIDRWERNSSRQSAKICRVNIKWKWEGVFDLKRNNTNLQLSWRAILEIRVRRMRTGGSEMLTMIIWYYI